VGLRRLRATVRAFRRFLPDDELQMVRKCYRRLRAPLGQARDWDVFVAWLQSASAPDGVLRLALHKRDEMRARARRAIRSPAFTRLITRSRALVPEKGAVDALARRAVASARRAALRHGRGMDCNDDADLHELRIRLRRERYICEAFARGSRAYIDRLKALQETLGELNDVRVARTLLKQLKCHDFDAVLRARREALLSALRAKWAAYLAARRLPRPATARAGADARARAPRGRLRPRTPAARPAAGGHAPAR
jgi:CHAD domain-containing protein